MPLKQETAQADELIARSVEATNKLLTAIRARGGRVQVVQRLDDDGSLIAVSMRAVWPEAPEVEDLLG